jgi:phosphatidylserine decarboxylase
MKIHKEGYIIILVSFLLLGLLNFCFFYYSEITILNYLIFSASIVFFILILLFFRCPARILSECEDIIYAPADGKIVVIEDTQEEEYYKDKRKQISIFMSPFNVHVNRFPIGGTVTYFKYHPGKYLVAWHPKASLNNERATTVIETPHRKSILIRQIAGAVARRVVTYSKVGKIFHQGDELGFIKFGSRVDLFLPVNAELKISMNEKVYGNRTIIAKI